MRLLRREDNGNFNLVRFDDEAIPPYAILSHTWGLDSEEVTFDDLANGAGKNKGGYEKILFCGERAAQDGLEWFWIDTCCINKTNKAELSEAIRCMFRWYSRATRCYVYLSDVSSPHFNTSDIPNLRSWELDFRESKWFTRGWTLQELLAPSSVEFFSQERNLLGDRELLIHQIHEITGLPKLALQRTPLSKFSKNERLAWIEHRQTKLEEDRAYSLLGILDVHIPPVYGEGMASAFKRLNDEINALETCLQDLRLTNPYDDKMRIEDTKGGLLEDSYRWILEDQTFQQWCDNQQHGQLLWIKGDPGKGKTMLLCGIINELEKLKASSHTLSYFFCQATDSRINKATAVLRGLLYMLIDQQPTLVSHIRKEYDRAGKTLFEDTNAWVALSEIFANILQDTSLNTTYLIIDAVDECVTDLPRLLDFITQHSSTSSRVKWIFSSRNWPVIEERLAEAGHKATLSLELNADSVSAAVDCLIQHKVLQLVHKKKYDDKVQQEIQHYLTLNANDTFLWVALVCQNLMSVPRWRAVAALKAFPPGLDALYKQMMNQISTSGDANLCRRILALVAIVYRPITVMELTTLVEMLEDMAEDIESLHEIIGLCGSLLTIRKGTIYFVHQSVKDFLLKEAFSELFPAGSEEAHHMIFSRSLQVLSKTLQRDMYDLRASGYPAEEVQQPDPDPLRTSRYACIYWVDHLHDCCAKSSTKYSINLHKGGIVDTFLRQKYLYWLESLSLLKSMSKGVVSVAKLEALIKRDDAEVNALFELVRDARRFIMYHTRAIELAPLQAYASALLFSPTRSLIRKLFEAEAPNWLVIKPAMSEKWSACLLTLEGHSNVTSSVAFSHNSTRLASASWDRMIKIWDTSSGDCIKTLVGHSSHIGSVAFSHDSTRLASASFDHRARIWDTGSGDRLHTCKGHNGGVLSVTFSHDSTWIASGSTDGEVKIWDTRSGNCLQTLRGHSGFVASVAFSHNSAQLASASHDTSVKIWDTSSGDCIKTLLAHQLDVTSVAFSHDSAQLVSASGDRTVKIWDVGSGNCIRTLKHYSRHISSVAFSHDSALIASGSADCRAKIWDTRSGKCLQTLEGHSDEVQSVAFSHDSAQLATASYDKTVKIWDINSDGHSQMLKDHSNKVVTVAFSHDYTRIASGHDCTIKIWDTCNVKCLQKLKGHSSWVRSVTFSHNSVWLASWSLGTTIKIWDVASGNCIRQLHGQLHGISCLAFSYDSALLASGSHEHMIEVWDTRSGDSLQILTGHSESVKKLAFSRDSTTLASVSTKNTVKVWDLSSGQCLETIKINEEVYRISFGQTKLYLHTETGIMSINLPFGSLPNPQSQYKGLTLSSDQAWIMYNSEKLVWIPSEYRPSCSAVSRDILTVGVASGRVWTCEVNPITAQEPETFE